MTDSLQSSPVTARVVVVMHVEIPFPLEAMIEDLGTKLSRKVKESHCLGSNQWNNHFQSLWEHIGTVQTEDHILKFIADKDIKSREKHLMSLQSLGNVICGATFERHGALRE